MNDVENPFNGDRPIERISEDRLGVRAPAEHVADAIHGMASPDGFVIGIEGEWGSGKSSFINLVADSLRQSENAPEIIRFLPWLINSRDGLLSELFAEITKAAISIDSDAVHVGWWKEKVSKAWPKRHSAQKARKRRIGGLLSRFSSRLVQAGKLAEVFGLPGAGVATEVGARSVEEWLGNGSLGEEKLNIQKELRSLKRKIVVFIDDLDRLEPGEVREILRLVRAVVDFPKIVFVLCYSREIVSKNLSAALHIPNGDAFLEKIVQVSFPVPQPEAFDLRRMFRHDLQLLYPGLLGADDARSRSIGDRLARVIDDEGGRALLTPRHVVRAINALRFHAAAVVNDIDIPDMVWLQLVRIQSPKLHQWIEGYLIGFAAKQAGAMIAEQSKYAELEELNSILDEMDNRLSSGDARRIALLSLLPGIEFDTEREDGRSTLALTLYGQEDAAERVRDRRLGSPQHFRYYFALTEPQNSISDKEFSAFLVNIEHSPKAAIAQFNQLASTSVIPGRVAVQPLMDRLKGKGIEDIPQYALPTVLEVLSDCMDLAALTTGRGDWGEYWIWRDAENLFEAIWPTLTEDVRAGLAKKLFRFGSSIGWLTEVFRGEMSAHGINDGSERLESGCLMSRSELDSVASELLRRYGELTPNDLDRLPRMAPLLYAWMHYDPTSLSEIQRKVEEICQRDEDFLKFLEGMRNWRTTNGAILYPLRESNLSSFMDAGQVKERLKQLTDCRDSSVARQARELLDALVTE